MLSIPMYDSEKQIRTSSKSKPLTLASPSQNTRPPGFLKGLIEVFASKKPIDDDPLALLNEMLATLFVLMHEYEKHYLLHRELSESTLRKDESYTLLNQGCREKVQSNAETLGALILKHKGVPIFDPATQSKLSWIKHEDPGIATQTQMLKKSMHGERRLRKGLSQAISLCVDHPSFDGSDLNQIQRVKNESRDREKALLAVFRRDQELGLRTI